MSDNIKVDGDVKNSVVVVQGLCFQFNYSQFFDLENTFGLVQLQFPGFKNFLVSYSFQLLKL